MAAKDEGIDIDITVSDFADIVEQDHTAFMDMLNDDSEPAKLLRSFFSEEFIAGKDAEMKKYVADLRAEGDADAVQE
jgi:hypothetical protein